MIIIFTVNWLDLDLFPEKFNWGGKTYPACGQQPHMGCDSGMNKRKKASFTWALLSISFLIVYNVNSFLTLSLPQWTVALQTVNQSKPVSPLVRYVVSETNKRHRMVYQWYRRDETKINSVTEHLISSRSQKRMLIKVLH